MKELQLMENSNVLLQGNAANRRLIHENNIVDCINYLLRSGKYKEVASSRQVRILNSIIPLEIGIIKIIHVISIDYELLVGT